MSEDILTIQVPVAENLVLRMDEEEGEIPHPVPIQQESPLVGVLILVGEGRSPTDERVQTLRNLFSDSMFIVQVVPWTCNGGTTKGSSENTQVINALTLAATEWPNSDVILVRDSSVSNADPNIVARKVRMGNNAQDWDLYYLCKWSDQCQKYTNVSLPEEEIRAGGSYLAWTFSPYGLQAILFSPTGRNIVLGRQPMRNGSFFPNDEPIGVQLQEEILNGNMRAICTVPNLFDYDISLATKNSDFLKLNECQPVPQEVTSTGSSAAALFYFLILIVLIFLLAWAFLRVGPRR